MSCCKVKIDKQETSKQTKFSKFKEGIVSAIVAILLLTLAFPVIYVICIYFIISGQLTNETNSVGRMVKVLKNNLIRIRKGDFEMEFEDDEDLFDDLVENPHKYEIIGLDEEHKN